MPSKKFKLSGKNAKVSSPFDSTIHKTEWTGAAKVAEWINDLVQEKDLPFGKAEEKSVSTR